MKKLFTLFCLLTYSFINYGQTTYFSQDFLANTTIGNYVGTPASMNQFSEIPTVTGITNTITNGRYQTAKSGTVAVNYRFGRNVDFASEPKSMYCQFNFGVATAAAVTKNNAIVLSLGGSGIVDGATVPTAANTYAKLNFNLIAGGVTFQLNDGTTNSANFTGNQDITFVMNNTGTTFTYVAPDGTNETLGNDLFDVWVGTTKVFNDRPVTTATQSIKRFRFDITHDAAVANAPTVSFDNFLMRDVTGSLLVNTNVATPDSMLVKYTGAAKNVGLGTTTPNAKLEVNPTTVNTSGVRLTQLKSTSPAVASNGKVLSVNTNGDIVLVKDSLSSGGGISPWTTTGANISNSNTGGVGIGTTTPSTKLTIQDFNPTLRLETTQSPTGYYTEMTSLYDGSQPFVLKVGTDKLLGIKRLMYNNGNYISYINGRYGIGFTTQTGDPDSTSLKMFIASNGNIGIGTYSKVYQTLNINGGIGFANQNNADKKLYSPTDGDLEWMTNNLAAGHGFAISNNGTKAVYLNTSGNSYLNGGNVGVGTTTPQTKLDVRGSIIAANTDYVNGTTGSFLQIQQGAASGNTYSEIGAYSNGGNVLNNLVLNRTGGNVGIGTATPTNKLEINGTGSGLRFTNLKSTSLPTSYTGKVLSVDANGDVVLVKDSVGTVGAGANAWAVNGTNISSTNSGNLGIGTTTPLSKFEVTSNLGKFMFLWNGNSHSYIDVDSHNFRTKSENQLLQLNSNYYHYMSGIFNIVPPSNTADNLNNSGKLRLVNGTQNSAGYIEFGRANSEWIGYIGYNHDNMQYTTYNNRHHLFTGGNVGIGTAIPANKLEINGTGSGLRFTNLKMNASNTGKVLSVDANGDVVLVKDSVGTVGAGASAWAVSGSNIFNSNTANVGIGTNNPLYKLQVVVPKGTNQVTSGAFRIIDGANNPGLFISNEETTGITSLDFSGTAGYQGRLRVGGIDVISLLNNSNVGIGTTTPTSKLEIQGATGLKIASTDGIHTTFKGRTGDNAALMSFNTNSDVLSTQFGHVGNELRFYTGGISGTVPVQRMVVTNGGNVGIGTGGPNALLDVNGSLQSKVMIVNDGSGANSVVNFNNANTNHALIGIAGAAGNLSPGSVLGDLVFRTQGKQMLFTTNSGSGTAMSILPNGNVGIGTTTPTTKLDIAGTARITSQLYLSNSANSPYLTYGAIPNTYTFGDNNAYFMNINTSNGNVGIGTTSPSAKLEVAGTTGTSGLKLSGLTGTSTRILGVDSTGKVVVTTNNNPSANAWTLTGNNISNTTLSGNVGIGTATPSQKLTILNPNASTIRLEAAQDPATYATEISNIWNATEPFSVKTGTTKIMGVKVLDSGLPFTYLNNYFGLGFSTGVQDPDSNSVKMIIKNDGKVGIGTRKPLGSLQIGSYNNSQANDLVLFANGGNAATGNSIKFDMFVAGGVTRSRIAEIQSVSYENNFNKLKFNVGGWNNNATTSTVMTLQDNGNVGIGTATPGYKLDAVGNNFYFGSHLNNTTSTNLNIGAGPGANSVINFGYYGTFDASIWNIGRWGTDQSFRISNFGSGNEFNVMTALQSGNVGIGTTTPNELLEIGGNGRVFIGDGGGAARKGLLIDGNEDGTYVRLHPYSYGENKSLNLVISPVGGGNVGIGTTSPSAKLEVAGTTVTTALKLSGLTGGSGNRPLAVNASGEVIVDAANNNPSANAWTLTGNNISNSVLTGNVGIGTATPTQKLSVIGQGVFGSSVAGIDPGDGVGSAIRIGYSTSGDFGYILANNTGVAGKNLVLQSNGNGGNVGIGTINPTEKLEIGGNMRLNGNLFMNGSGDGTSFLSFFAGRNLSDPNFGGFDFNNNTGWTGWKSTHSFIQINNVGFFDIRKAENNASVTVPTSLFRIIASSGNVGIGTENPTTKLDVNGGGAFKADNTSNIGVQIFNNANGRALIQYGGNEWYVGNEGGKFNFYNSKITSSAGYALSLSDNGNVGIGITTPTHKLSVNGDALVGQGSNGSGIIVRNNQAGTFKNDFLIAGKADQTYLGNYQNLPIGIYTGNVERMRISADGNVGIGVTTLPTGYKLAVAGDMIAERVVVKLQSSGWPDYVFTPTYHLATLPEVEKYIEQNHHLPNIPSAKEVADKGIDVGAMNTKFMEKIEELTLYLIEQNKKLEALEKKNIELENTIKSIKK